MPALIDIKHLDIVNSRYFVEVEICSNQIRVEFACQLNQFYIYLSNIIEMSELGGIVINFYVKLTSDLI